MTLELKKFDMSYITFKKEENKGPVVVLIGRRDTGKSFLVRDLLYHHRNIPLGTVISGTEAGNGFYSQHVPKLFIHEEYNFVEETYSVRILKVACFTFRFSSDSMKFAKGSVSLFVKSIIFLNKGNL